MKRERKNQPVSLTVSIAAKSFAFLLLVAAMVSVGCGAKTPSGGGPGNNPVPAAPTPITGVLKPLGKDVEIISSARFLQKGPNGSVANTSIGSPASKTNIKTANGYQVYLSVISETGADGR